MSLDMAYILREPSALDAAVAERKTRLNSSERSEDSSAENERRMVNRRSVEIGTQTSPNDEMSRFMPSRPMLVSSRALPRCNLLFVLLRR